MTQALDDLAAARVSVWLDDLSRPRIQTGSLAHMVDAGENRRHHDKSNYLCQSDRHGIRLRGATTRPSTCRH
jgi:hypothetical protein